MSVNRRVTVPVGNSRIDASLTPYGATAPRGGSLAGQYSRLASHGGPWYSAADTTASDSTADRRDDGSPEGLGAGRELSEIAGRPGRPSRDCGSTWTPPGLEGRPG